MNTPPTGAHATELAAAFGALAHERRLQIMTALLQRLSRDAEPNASMNDHPHWVRFKELQVDLEIGQSTLSYHLQSLEKAGLLERATSGRSTYLRGRADQVRALAKYLGRSNGAE